jgi:hypothetical protein
MDDDLLDDPGLLFCIALGIVAGLIVSALWPDLWGRP